MNRIIRLTLLVVSLTFTPLAANADQASSESVKALMQLTGAGQIGMQETMAVGQQWGQDLAKKVMQKYEEQSGDK